MNISALIRDFNQKSGEQYISQNWFVAYALIYVIKNYFLKRASHFTLTLSCRDYHTCSFYNDIMEPLFQLWDMQIVQLIVVHMNSTTRIPGDRIYNMMLTDSYTAFLKTDIASYTRDNNNNEYYFIFLQTPDHLLKDEMQQIFNYCWLHYLINCVVQVQTERGEVLLYTYFPFTAKYCYKIEPVLFNQFKGAGFTKSELFPRKLKNFYGCKLKAALWHLVPLVTLETNVEGQVKINGGFEGNMLNVLAQKLNFSVEIWIPPEAVKRGTLVNGSFNGAIGMTEKHTADLTIAGFRQTLERSRVASPTVVYRQDHVVACIHSQPTSGQYS
ncbi:uncharacterized protein LOC119667119 [Teleopsis dalmanni]|uniref:uncharacterized protein LOC119667119 n=1 Tax=Teleopsis dalmanni TaxID=139649 RepID=UPI0018CC84AE|nr:uncharacterized protein LOC119667119 [Teleopsis dalmanni]